MTPARRILLLLSLVLPVALWTGSTSYESAKFLLWSLAGSAWLCLAGLAALRGRAAVSPSPWLLLAAASQMLLMAPGLGLAAAPALTARALYWTFLWWLVVVATALLLRDDHDRRRLVACAGGGAAAAAGAALLQMAGLAPTTAAWYVPIGIGTLGNENFVAELAAIWLVPSLLLPLGTRAGPWRPAAWLPTATLLGVLVASPAVGARIGVLAAAAFAMVGAMLSTSRHRARGPVILGAALLAIALVAGVTVRGVLAPARDAAGAGSLADRLFAANHGAERRTNWLVATDLMKAAPLAGCGAGNYGTQWLQARARLGSDLRWRNLATDAPPATRAHNEYLQWAAETGWFGVAWLAGAAIAGSLAWARAWRLAVSREARRELLLAASGLVAAAVIALVSFPAHRPASGLAIALLAGVLAAAHPARAARFAAPLPRVAVLLLPLGLCIAAFAVGAFRADLLLARGARLFTAGENTAALRDLGAGVAWSPWPGEGRLYLGLALAGEKRYAEAAMQLEASLRERPSFEAPLALAELSIDGGSPDTAGRWLDLVEGCAPATGMAQQAGYLRAYSLLRAGRFAEAAAGFSALAAEDELDHRSRLGLGYARTLLGDRAGATEAYREAIAGIEALLAAPHPATAEAQGQRLRLGRQLEAARRALSSLGG